VKIWKIDWLEVDLTKFAFYSFPWSRVLRRDTFKTLVWRTNFPILSTLISPIIFRELARWESALLFSNEVLGSKPRFPVLFFFRRFCYCTTFHFYFWRLLEGLYMEKVLGDAFFFFFSLISYFQDNKNVCAFFVAKQTLLTFWMEILVLFSSLNGSSSCGTVHLWGSPKDKNL